MKKQPALSERIKTITKRLLKYAVSAGTASLISIALIFLLVDAQGIPYLYIIAPVFIFAHSINCILNHQWCFKETSRQLHKGYAYFIGFGIIGLGILTTGIYFFMTYLGFSAALAYGISLPVSGTFNFVMNYTITFQLGHEIHHKLKKKQLF